VFLELISSLGTVGNSGHVGSGFSHRPPAIPTPVDSDGAIEAESRQTAMFEPCTANWSSARYAVRGHAVTHVNAKRVNRNHHCPIGKATHTAATRFDEKFTKF
jgi:hypothetical protein